MFSLKTISYAHCRGLYGPKNRRFCEWMGPIAHTLRHSCAPWNLIDMSAYLWRGPLQGSRNSRIFCLTVGRISRRFEHLTLHCCLQKLCEVLGSYEEAVWIKKRCFFAALFLNPKLQREEHGFDCMDVVKEMEVTFFKLMVDNKKGCSLTVLNAVHKKQELRWLPVVTYRKELALRWEPGAAYAANWHGCWAHSETQDRAVSWQNAGRLYLEDHPI